MQDLLWGGRQPGRLVKDLLERRIEIAYRIPAGLDSAGAGRWEEGWFWKLDDVIPRVSAAVYFTLAFPALRLDAHVCPATTPIYNGTSILAAPAPSQEVKQ